MPSKIATNKVSAQRQDVENRAVRPKEASKPQPKKAKHTQNLSLDRKRQLDLVKHIETRTKSMVSVAAYLHRTTETKSMDRFRQIIRENIGAIIQSGTMREMKNVPATREAGRRRREKYRNDVDEGTDNDISSTDRRS